MSPHAVRAVRFRDPQIEMAHGAGGKASRRLVEGLSRRSARPAAGAARRRRHCSTSAARGCAFTTDSFVVSPLRFPGGSIGELAVNGTVNDLAVSGARPLALVVTLRRSKPACRARCSRPKLRALGDAGARAGVAIVGGDTKVVEHGKADGMYITTAGHRPADAARALLAAARVRPGDRVLLSGPIGDHGITILLARGDLDLEADLRPTRAPCCRSSSALVDAAGAGLRWMRDPTRGGVATSLNELARDCGSAIALGEDDAAGPRRVRGACELLGLDPLHIANEGQFLAVVAPELADAALAALRACAGRRGGAPSSARSRDAARAAPCSSSPATAARASSTCWSAIRCPGSAEAPDGITPVLATRRRRCVATCSRAQRASREHFSRARPSGSPRACREMSERFLRGGRLLAFGRGAVRDRRAARRRRVRPSGDRRQARAAGPRPVAALRAVARALVRPDDIVMGFGPPEGDAGDRDGAARRADARRA